MRVLLPCVILAAGAGILVLLVRTAPEPEQEASPRPERAAVQVVRARAPHEPPIVPAQGRVIAAHEVTLTPEIAGVVAWMSSELVVGGRFRRGETVLRLDRAPFELEVAGARARIAEAELVLAEERAEQRVQQRTRALFPEDAVAGEPTLEEGRELARREPHVERAERLLDAARADLGRARLDLERTTLRSPCDCVVAQALVALGSRVGPQHPVARLVETQAYHVEVSVALDVLDGVGVPPAEPSPARVVTTLRGREHVWSGQVIRLAPDLTERGSLAQLVVEVPDPLGLREPDGPREVPLLLGSFVRVELEARPLEGAVRIPAAAVRPGERLWVASEEDRLEIRAAEVAWRTEEAAFVTGGVAVGERVVVSRLTAPVEGMRLEPLPLEPDEISEMRLP